MFSSVNSVGLFGMNAYAVTAEISTQRGIPSFDIVGLADVSVQESRMRIRSAMNNSELNMKKQQIIINLAPASVKKSGACFDLAILTAILAAQDEVNIDIEHAAFIGEVSLSGNVSGVAGALTMAIAAKENGMTSFFLPAENAVEASVVDGLNIYPVENVRQLAAHLYNGAVIKPQERYLPQESSYDCPYDFAEVKGQENAKKALEISAAGFHNVLMIGPPGTGKSMLAKRLPSILPRMTFEESIETTQIHSVAGIVDTKNPLVVMRPFRDISHTASAVGLIGGGSIPRPGEISLAHNGVLFLDEFPEFDRRVLETLRQPLENGEITISRAQGSVCYPCNIMLIAAMNPCPCGNFGHPTKKCTCSPQQVQRYLARISQPVLDRIDIQVEVAPVNFDEINSKRKSEESKLIRERVQKARDIQEKRFKGTGIKANSMISPKLLHEVCVMDNDAQEQIKTAFEKLGLSARAYDRVLKVSRTIADLDGAELIGKKHIAKAIQYRSLDRKYWGNT